MEKIKTVLLVVNPISGGLDKADLIKSVKRIVTEIEAELVIFQTTGEEDIFNLEIKIKELNPCRIIIAGGDGTIKITAEALNKKEIPVGVLPAGSANGLSVNLLLPDAVDEQLNIALGNNFKELDVIVLDDEICLHMSDFGLNAELIRRYENSSIRGKLGYLLQSIPTLIESDYPFKFEIEAENDVYKREAILLAIANAKAYGTGAAVNPEGKIDDGKFELLIFKNFDVLEILKTLRNEVKLDPEFVEIISTTRAKITCAGPIAFQVDGEFLGEKDSVHVSVSPVKLKIAVPEELE